MHRTTPIPPKPAPVCSPPLGLRAAIQRVQPPRVILAARKHGPSYSDPVQLNPTTTGYDYEPSDTSVSESESEGFAAPYKPKRRQIDPEKRRQEFKALQDRLKVLRKDILKRRLPLEDVDDGIDTLSRYDEIKISESKGHGCNNCPAPRDECSFLGP